VYLIFNVAVAVVVVIVTVVVGEALLKIKRCQAKFMCTDRKVNGDDTRDGNMQD
jgi:hypothetical protein